MPVLPSPSALPDDVREKIARRANDIVLDLFALKSVAHKAHTNIRGENFGSLHAQFASIYEAAEKHGDTISEFVGMLGVVCRMDVFDIVAGATKGIGPMPDAHDCDTLCRVMYESIRTMLGECDAAADEIRELGSRNGEQLLIDVSIAFHHLGWMTLAYMFEEPGEAPSRPGVSTGREPARPKPAAA